VNAPLLVVVDYGMGNRRSVQKALEHVGAIATITSDHEQIRAADGLVVPGVGAFPRAMANLEELGLGSLLRERVAEGVPLLGICLGMQLLFERSTELQETNGLGLLAGEVTLLESGTLRVPHIGWNDVSFSRECALTNALPEAGAPFYHVHSYAARPTDPADLVGTTEYGERFATFVARDNLFGVQFHPEKSSGVGLALLANFARVCGLQLGVGAAATTARA
jgi:imidazole glycerol-phosphate synthase subunit HisH